MVLKNPLRDYRLSNISGRWNTVPIDQCIAKIVRLMRHIHGAQVRDPLNLNRRGEKVMMC
jgi:hypothetical protein